MIDIQNRLSLLQQKLRQQQIDFYIVPSTDAHNNEYLPQCWQRRAWISGFTGSAGECLIARDHSYLSTDGRYFLQAETQLDPAKFTILRQNGFVPDTEVWLSDNASRKTVGIDPRLMSIARVKRIEKIMDGVAGKVVILDKNLIDAMREQMGEEVKLPVSEAFILQDSYSGESIHNKLEWLRSELRKQHANYIVLNVLDEIAWLFNLRGSDVEFNPLIICYAIIGLTDTYLYVDDSKIGSDVLAVLNRCKITLDKYENFANSLARLNGKVWLDERTANYWIYDRINQANKTADTDKTVNFYFASSPIIFRKALKNNTEIKGSIDAHKKDAVALMNFFHWLENNWQSGIDELGAATKLEEFRSRPENYLGLSFNTISGFGAHSAVIHYGVTPETSIKIDDSNIFLLDSGSQYLEGTTDVTRTIHLGLPTANQKRHYTLVLKGHLALGRAVFTHGTCGEHLDVLARAPLWNEYINYRHGTGHGVGSCLCVHEGPQKISQAVSGVSLVPGMIVSNEPGCYLENQYGIRIENLCLVVEATDARAKTSEFGPFYKFETLTLMPYCKTLIELNLLTDEEKQQIKDYYAVIHSNIRHLLDKPVQQWLDRELALFA